MKDRKLIFETIPDNFNKISASIIKGDMRVAQSEIDNILNLINVSFSSFSTFNLDQLIEEFAIKSGLDMDQIEIIADCYWSYSKTDTDKSRKIEHLKKALKLFDWILIEDDSHFKFGREQKRKNVNSELNKICI